MIIHIGGHRLRRGRQRPAGARGRSDPPGRVVRRLTTRYHTCIHAYVWTA